MTIFEDQRDTRIDARSVTRNSRLLTRTQKFRARGCAETQDGDLGLNRIVETAALLPQVVIRHQRANRAPLRDMLCLSKLARALFAAS